MTEISASPGPSRGTQGIRVLGLLGICGLQVHKPLLNCSGNSRWVSGLASEVSALLGEFSMGGQWEGDCWPSSFHFPALVGDF